MRPFTDPIAHRQLQRLVAVAHPRGPQVIVQLRTDVASRIGGQPASEHCIMAVRGAPVVELTNHTTVLYAPVPRDASGRPIHSAKPAEFYRFVESLCPAPRYAELFQRTARAGWDGHGDEVPRQRSGSDDSAYPTQTAS